MHRSNRLPAIATALIVTALLVLGMVPSVLLAADTEPEPEPLHLTADRGELDNAEGVSTYTGNVEVSRGPMRITGDELRVYRGDDGDLARIEVEGSPATFHDESTAREASVNARAPRMVYHAGPPERIRLSEGALLTRGRDEFRGQTVNYNIATDRVEADSGEQQRVEVTLYPERDKVDDGR